MTKKKIIMRNARIRFQNSNNILFRIVRKVQPRGALGQLAVVNKFSLIRKQYIFDLVRII